MSKVYDFMKENGMLAESIDAGEAENAFLKDMEEKRSLRMLPTFQRCLDGELKGEKLLAIDAGGTNLRFALLEDGKVLKEDRMFMFGIGEEVSADAFFDRLAGQIAKYDADKVGFCFSYPCEIQENRDGKILAFAKEIKIKGAEGKLLGEELNKRLEKKRVFSVINDTVAAQLGVGADAGIILGTGFNICFTDREKDMIVVSECGLYEGIPYGKFDEELCVKLGSPNKVAEKLLAGAYLGKTIRIAAEKYFGRRFPSFELKDVSEFLIGEGVLYSCFSTMERAEFREMISLFQKRGAFIVALMVKCLLRGYDKATIALEGSTVYKMPGYHEALKDALDDIPGLECRLKDARGTLYTGCMRCLL